MYQFTKVANAFLVELFSRTWKNNFKLPLFQQMLYRCVCIFALSGQLVDAAENLPAIITQVKPSVVAIAIFNPTASPRMKLLGSGFVIAPGDRVVTNYHVVSTPTDSAKNETYVVLSGHGQQPRVHQILKLDNAPQHDLALLQIDGQLPSVKLASSDYIAEGTELAFTGYPITGVLGLYPATHRAMLSAISPVAIPADNSQVISAATLRQLREPFFIYQLDGTAYPGNSGSMLYQQDSGEVIGIINMVLVKKSREAVLSDPSGISYAIPVKHLHDLIRRASGEAKQ